MSSVPKTGRGCCTWCGEEHDDLTDDHVFPRSMGGTKELAVPACENCQIVFSKAETEATRCSVYGLHIVNSGPRGRHRRRSSSGVIRTKYTLVRHPLGGFGEVGLRAGSGTLEALPHIEIDVNQRQGRVRGNRRIDVDRLLSTLSSLLDHAPDQTGLVGEITVRIDDLGTIGEDTDFWPRIVLGMDGRLFIRARNQSEAMNFLSFLVSAFRAGAFVDKGTWTNSEITAGTVHIAAIEYDPKSVQCVVLKIALGVLYLGARDGAAFKSAFPQDPSSSLEERLAKAAIAINHFTWPETIGAWPDRHVAMIDVRGGRLRAVVSLYGDCHTVDLGPTQSPQGFKHIVAFCRRDGARTFWVADAEADRVVQLLDKHLADRDVSQAP